MYKKSSVSYKSQKPIELIGVIPRSIIRTFNRFFIQLFPNSKALVIQEFRISRYQVFVSIQCLLSLIFIPLIMTFLSRTFVLSPLTEYFWNTQNQDIFLNSYLEKEALSELHNFEEQLYFDYFLSPNTYETPNWASYQKSVNANKFQSNYNDFPEMLKSEIQKKTLELATEYNEKSIESLTNLFSDFLSFGTFALLVILLKPQIIILKSFLIESIYSLSDTIKSFLLILGTDLLVGFHSPRGWELFLEFVLDRFAFPHNENFIFLFVATLPVLLDTVFKYWIFRYLNKISPSTVATYHAMIE
uniref:envelope membrane protein n=1 Tax=Gayralia brasiliensis TaxID=1286870 RepID=UPI002410BEAF|nr:envelope membrane protein [Gayralia brasiliensis]YP_010733735.1 envelope membrane protein [Monostroma nitidum]WEG92932.1 envelope membrane protein [Gayralia brasiliensis]WEG93006.1 envelope membrane protein [Monostroma nitidum]